MSALIIALVIAGIVFAISRSVFMGIVVFLVNWAGLYYYMPVLNFWFRDLAVTVLFNGGAVLVFEAFIRDDAGSKTVAGSLVLCAVSLVVLVIVPIFTDWSFFHSHSYRNLIGEVEEGKFSTDTAPVDIFQMRTVDEEIAQRLADKVLGESEDTGLGSRVNVGDVSLQLVKGKLFWVAPLNHSGFGKWLKNSKGTPGYIMVSATNSMDRKLVDKIEGQPIRLRYNQGSFFGDLPKRRIYQKGYCFVGLADFTFEIDDTGRPYWVVTRYEKTVGFSGRNAIGVAVLDAQTGVVREYGINDAPEWIDRIQPEEFVIEQLDDWGSYVHGWLNSRSWWSQSDVLAPTKGTSLVYGKDGNSHWYTGITSAGADEGTVGFVLVDTRTKEARFYQQSGATELSAMRSAEGAVQQMKYKGSFPILYNVNALPTYFVILKDAGGLAKAYAFVSVQSHEIVGFGETVSQAATDYRRILREKGAGFVPDGAMKRLEVVATVLRKASETVGKGTVYYLLLEGVESKLFAVSSSPEAIVTQPRDEVRVIFYDGGGEVVDVAEFDNLGFDFQKTASQVEAEAAFEKVKKEAEIGRRGQNADAAWGEMSPKEKAALMDGVKKNGK